MQTALKLLVSSIRHSHSVFGAMGGLAGHYCDVPIGISLDLFSEGSFGSRLVQGYFYSNDALNHVMSFMGLSSDVIKLALEVNGRIKSATTTSEKVVYTTEDKSLITSFLGGTKRSTLEQQDDHSFMHDIHV
tara:strand:- start:12 stop:407 length:396 start_codon:yes stop_codon:yes gene_type:complete